jgi:hypothetical protein
VLASAQLEFWYFGCLVYQLCTEDGATLWHANQADNIDDEQMRQLAYKWPEHRGAKLKKIVSDWPAAAHLADWLLQDDPSHRPQSWKQVLQHPAFASVAGPPARKRVVMSCPEVGTLDADGGPPYDQRVMDKVSELQQLGFVKFGFDRAGTSTAVGTVEEKKKWSKAEGTLAVAHVGDAMRSVGLTPSDAELQEMIEDLDTNGLTVESDGGDMRILADTIDFLDFVAMARKMKDATPEDKLKKSFWEFAEATPEDVKELIFKSTEWWYGYQTSVKQAVKLESQGFDGVLDVTCLRGGAITQLEAAEMVRIMHEAESDCAKSGISVKYEISYVSYHDFLLEYEPWSLEKEELSSRLVGYEQQEAVQSHSDAEVAGERFASRDVAPSSSESIVNVDSLRATLAAKDKELEELRAQLMRLEGVPPTGKD